MYLDPQAYSSTITHSLALEPGHFVVWDTIDGVPLIRVEHTPIIGDGRAVGIAFVGRTQDGVEVTSQWTDLQQRSSEAHGYQSFLIEVGMLLGRAIERRTIRREEERP